MERTVQRWILQIKCKLGFHDYNYHYDFLDDYVIGECWYCDHSKLFIDNHERNRSS